MSAMIQTVLELRIDEYRTLFVVLENRMRRVKFSLREKKGENSQTREEWYLSRPDSMKMAMFLAGIKQYVTSIDFDDDEVTPTDRPPKPDED